MAFMYATYSVGKNFVCLKGIHIGAIYKTRSPAVARMADRTAPVI